MAGAGRYHAEASGLDGAGSPCSRADPLPQCQVSITPAHGMSMLSLRSYARTVSWGFCAPNKSRSGEAKRNFQEERAPQAPAPTGATVLRGLWLAAGATTAGVAASAGARHKGRLCSRSSGCLPRAILLAPGRLPAPAAHTWAFHEESGDDLLPGGRGRGGRMEPQHAGARPLVRARCRGAPHILARPRVCPGGRLSQRDVGQEGSLCTICEVLRTHFISGRPAMSCHMSLVPQ